MGKTVFILLDGCGDKLAREHMGYLEHMAESQMAARYTVLGQLPSISRPIYETLLTGLPACEHGIVNNMTVRLTLCENIFGLCKQYGLTTAAAAYEWISELYNNAPFSSLTDRFQSRTEAAIQNGIFYFSDDYPDSHTLSDGEYLRKMYDPDFLMIHTMAIDAMGHRFGGGGKEQAEAAVIVDAAISLLLPTWLEQGYNVLITADHGMGADGWHGGNTDEQRMVPLYLFADKARNGVLGEMVSQLAVAPLLCALLGIKPDDRMLSFAGYGVKFFA